MTARVDEAGRRTIELQSRAMVERGKSGGVSIPLHERLTNDFSDCEQAHDTALMMFKASRLPHLR